jgi:hypothetical protein
MSKAFLRSNVRSLSIRTKLIGACAKALRPGGHAIFFEPFEIGFVVLRNLYEQLIANREGLGLTDDVVHLFRHNIMDTHLRTRPDKTDPYYHQFGAAGNDKIAKDAWSFIYEYEFKFSRHVIPELIMAGCIILSK